MFKLLELSEPLLRAIAEQGYSDPTPIQSQAIPIILAGHDLLGGAQTGTGKTAAFTLPLLQTLSLRPKSLGRSPRALILAPTRELAAQIAESIKLYGKYLSIKTAVIFGGVKINPQIQVLGRGVDIVVATPGRLLDHVNQRSIDLSKIEFLVLDEADRMLDMGFIRDIRRILNLLPKKRQNLLFSATFSPEISKLANQFLDNPRQVQVSKQNTTAPAIAQLNHPVDTKRKRELLSYLIKSKNLLQVLVFTRTKHGANRLSEQLGNDGIRAAAIHGNKSQGARTRALADFKQGLLRVLVATDIAARGIDIDQLPYVVNFELPNVPEDYVHRIGRTGRANSNGVALSLISIDEHKLLSGIEKLLKTTIPVEIIPGFEPNQAIRARETPDNRYRGRY